jgi:hypothetical protein
MMGSKALGGRSNQRVNFATFHEDGSAAYKFKSMARSFQIHFSVSRSDSNFRPRTPRRFKAWVLPGTRQKESTILRGSEKPKAPWRKPAIDPAV